ncbi:hypothetical protein BJV82DRAFT_492583, partial [Fennellomyces sp. T-0311]
QVAQQQVLIEQLLAAQGAPGAQTPPVSSVMDLHDLPTRPRYDWLPSLQLCELLPTLEQSIFGMPLSDKDCKALVDRYPSVAGLVYTPPATLPEAEHHFKTGHRHEDGSLRALQYTISAICRPLDVLAHTLL